MALNYLISQGNVLPIPGAKSGAQVCIPSTPARTCHPQEWPDYPAGCPIPVDSRWSHSESVPPEGTRSGHTGLGP